MAVILRLARRGATHRPFYHIVAADNRAPRDGRYLELIGRYDPVRKSELVVDVDKASKWIKNGAQQSPTVKKLLKKAGVSA